MRLCSSLLKMSGIEIIPCTYGLVTQVTFVFGAWGSAVPCSLLYGTFTGLTSTSLLSGISAIFSIVFSSVSFSSISIVLSIPSTLPNRSSTELYCWVFSASKVCCLSSIPSSIGTFRDTGSYILIFPSEPVLSFFSPPSLFGTKSWPNQLRSSSFSSGSLSNDWAYSRTFAWSIGMLSWSTTIVYSFVGLYNGICSTSLPIFPDMTWPIPEAELLRVSIDLLNSLSSNWPYNSLRNSVTGWFNNYQ